MGRSRSRTAALLVAAAILATALGVATWATRSPDVSGPGRSTAEPAGPPADPAGLTGWLRRIDRLRAEDRPNDAAGVGWAAYAAVSPRDRPEVLRALTLALLADVPADQARAALLGRVEADPGDLDARVALLRRSISPTEAPSARLPRVGRPPASGPDAVDELEALLDRAPDHPGTRAALVDALLDLGRVDRARQVLDDWPEAGLDDPRRLRLRARIDLDHDARPDRAAEALSRLVAATPHDWQLRARLARALERRGDAEGARRQARSVDRLRERLDPGRLGPRLADDLRRLDDPAALADLAALCSSVGLADLAAAWRFEAEAAAAPGDAARATAPSRSAGTVP